MAALEAGTPSTVASTNGDSGKYIIYEIIVGLVESSDQPGLNIVKITYFYLEKSKTLETFLMKTAEAMEKMRRIEGRVATDQVRSRTYLYILDI